MDRSPAVAKSAFPWKVHGWIAGAFCIAVPAAFLYANHLAEDAVARYGRNVDSGAYLSMFAIYFMVPAAALFAAAATALRLHWRIGPILHWLSVAWLALPVLLLLFAEGRRYIGA